MRGGKGDDKIGRKIHIDFENYGYYVDTEYVRDEDTDLFRRGEIKRVEPETYGFSTKENLYGEQGDDLMYGGSVYGTQTMHGGSGDDKVVAGPNIGSVHLYGNSGRDVVRSDQYDMVPRDCPEAN